jgi:hypothetical protein
MRAGAVHAWSRAPGGHWMMVQAGMLLFVKGLDQRSNT